MMVLDKHEDKRGDGDVPARSEGNGTSTLRHADNPEESVYASAEEGMDMFEHFARERLEEDRRRREYYYREPLHPQVLYENRNRAVSDASPGAQQAPFDEGVEKVKQALDSYRISFKDSRDYLLKNKCVQNMRNKWEDVLRHGNSTVMRIARPRPHVHPAQSHGQNTFESSGGTQTSPVTIKNAVRVLFRNARPNETTADLEPRGSGDAGNPVYKPDSVFDQRRPPFESATKDNTDHHTRPFETATEDSTIFRSQKFETATDDDANVHSFSRTREDSVNAAGYSTLSNYGSTDLNTKYDFPDVPPIPRYHDRNRWKKHYRFDTATDYYSAQDDNTNYATAESSSRKSEGNNMVFHTPRDSQYEEESMYTAVSDALAAPRNKGLRHSTKALQELNNDYEQTVQETIHTNADLVYKSKSQTNIVIEDSLLKDSLSKETFHTADTEVRNDSPTLPRKASSIHLLRNRIYQLCYKCNKLVKSGDHSFHYAEGLHRVWHEHCFTCTTCQIQLGQDNHFFYKGEPYCQAHYLLVAYVPTCHRCGQRILDDSYTSAAGYFWHKEHFNCFSCRTPLVDAKYIVTAGHVCCFACHLKLFEKICESCQHRITPREVYVQSDKYYWHFTDTCLRCETCHQSLVGRSFFFRKGGKLFCNRYCALQLPK